MTPLSVSAGGLILLKGVIVLLSPFVPDIDVQIHVQRVDK